MPFRNIVVENPARISVKNSQLIIHTDSDHSVAIEDISALLLESRQTTITAAALSTLGECGCCFTIPRNARELERKKMITERISIFLPPFYSTSPFLTTPHLLFCGS